MGKGPEIQDDSKKSADEIITILVVEDDEALRVVSRKVLELRGYTILEASDGPSALEKCKNHAGTIHLMITDIGMPRMGGFELASKVKPMRPDMKILYVSGYPQVVHDQRKTSKGVRYFLQKPYTPGTLIKIIQEILK